MKDQYYFIWDGESLGLHGEGFAVAGGVYKSDGTEVFTFAFDSPLHMALDNLEVRSRESEDSKWVAENVTIHPSSFQSKLPKYTRARFWDTWLTCKEKYPGIIMAVECGWPVEARFLEDCIKDDPERRNWDGPYPLHEIASIMLAAGMDPMATYERLPNELPAHEPLADARLSARLLFEALARLDIDTRTDEEKREFAKYIRENWVRTEIDYTPIIN